MKIEKTTICVVEKEQDVCMQKIKAKKRWTEPDFLKRKTKMLICGGKSVIRKQLKIN